MEPYYRDGDVIFSRALQYPEFLAFKQVPNLNIQLTSIAANAFSMSKFLRTPISDVLRGQALIDPILSTKVYLFYPKFPVDTFSLANAVEMPSHVDVAIIRKVVSYLWFFR